MFSPGQIDFEFQIYEDSSGTVGIKTAYSIDRKSLKHTDTTLDRIVFSSSSDTGWVPQKSTEKVPTPHTENAKL